jgi:hypothetical protein
MPSIHRIVFAAALAGALAGSLYEAGDAAAWAVRRSAAECYIGAPELGGTIQNGRITNNTDTALSVYCPTPEDATITGAAIKTINVHGYNAEPGDFTYASACDNSWYEDFASCRNTKQSGFFQGQLTLQLGAPSYASVYPAHAEANFKFIHVRLARRNATTKLPSTLRGIYFEG